MGVKSKFSVRCLHLDFGPYSSIVIDVMEYLGAGGPEVNSSNVDLGITTLAINLNLNSYMETLKIEHYKHYKRFTPFQKNIKNITIRTKNY